MSAIFSGRMLAWITLDGGDCMIRVDEIVVMRRVHITEPGDRTEITLTNGRKFTVPDRIEDITQMIREIAREASS